MSIIHLDQMQLSLNDVARITNGELFYSGSQTIKNISLDSREIEESTLFIAIKGERFDGHDYIGRAFESGAACILAERIPYKVKGNVILVDSTLDALAALARYYRETVAPFTVAITGSVGKTTTKQFVYSVLNQKYHTHKTAQNFNNEIGLPLTILKMERDVDALVLEMGMSFKGEIAHLSKAAEPDLAIITNIGSSHIENLGSREGIRDAKMEITEGLRPNGKLLLNADEPLLAGREGAIYVGIDNPDADYRACDLVENATGTTFNIVHAGGKCERIRINVPGRHNVLNAAFAYAVGNRIGMDDDDIKQGLLEFENVAMRQNIYEFEGKTFIEDCYNASPESMRAGLSVLAKTSSFRGGRKIAVLGNMLELGRFSPQLHCKVGHDAAEFKVDRLYCFGSDAQDIAEGAIEEGTDPETVFCFPDIFSVTELGSALKNDLKPGDIVLFKASRGVKLERVIEYLKG